MSYFRATLPIGAKLYSSGVILIDEYTDEYTQKRQLSYY